MSVFSLPFYVILFSFNVCLATKANKIFKQKHSKHELLYEDAVQLNCSGLHLYK